MEALENINIRTEGHWQQRNGNLKKNIQKKILLMKHTIIEMMNSLIVLITKSHIARGKINVLL